ncbi:MAG: hypothetical protein WKG00_24585 [Polyangiaceae bacterium]
MAKTRAAVASSGKGGGRKNQEERAAKQARRKAAAAEARAAAASARDKAERDEAERDVERDDVERDDVERDDVERDDVERDDVERDDVEAEAERHADDRARKKGVGARKGAAGKARGDATAASAAASPAADHAPIDERITRYAKLGVPLVTLGTAAVVGITLGTPPALLVLAGGALVAVIATFWASVRTLLGETPLGGADAYALGAPRAEEEQKRAVLRALKDLEFERSIGKISEEDYAELVAKYREEAKRLLRVLDTDAAPARRQIEVLVARRLRDEGLASSADVADAEDAARDPGAAKSGKRERVRVGDEELGVGAASRWDDAVDKMAAERAEEEADAEAELQRELDEEKKTAQRAAAEPVAAKDELDEDLDAPMAPEVPAQTRVPADIAARSAAEDDAPAPAPSAGTAPTAAERLAPAASASAPPAATASATPPVTASTAPPVTASATPLPGNGGDRPIGGSSMPPRIGSLHPAPLRRKAAGGEATESTACAECGTMNDADAVFCKKCGTRRAAAARDDA